VKPKPFTLRRLLEVRRLRQKRQQGAFAAASRAVRQQEAEVERAIGRQMEAREALTSLLMPGTMPGATITDIRPVPVSEVKQYRAYLSALAQQAGQAATSLPALRQSEAAQRVELVEAQRAVKALENLRDRREAAFRQWRRRRDQSTLDDQANTRFVRDGGQ